MKTKLFIAAMAALVTSFVAAPASADMLDDIIARKTIRVAVPTDYPPFGSVGSDMQPQGMDIDMARLIAKAWASKSSLSR